MQLHLDTKGGWGNRYKLHPYKNVQRVEIENCCFSMKSRKPQLMAFLATDTMSNFVEKQHTITLM